MQEEGYLVAERARQRAPSTAQEHTGKGKGPISGSLAILSIHLMPVVSNVPYSLSPHCNLMSGFLYSWLRNLIPLPFLHCTNPRFNARAFSIAGYIGNLIPCLFAVFQEAIHEKYGVPGDQLRIYLHYQPSYYHLHVHFTQLSYTAPKSCVGEAHLLADVISNIETIDPEYYQKCSLSFTVTESSLLRKAYQEHQ